ncbi:hypothetical protein K438DRAFT_1816226 [Mycena galopus ATCC 62051]|nr:hypothetical protein K438DRAFT_1816226 [Mycena galopus ATCC 62051]
MQRSLFSNGHANATMSPRSFSTRPLATTSPFLRFGFARRPDPTPIPPAIQRRSQNSGPSSRRIRTAAKLS